MKMGSQLEPQFRLVSLVFPRGHCVIRDRATQRGSIQHSVASYLTESNAGHTVSWTGMKAFKVSSFRYPIASAF